MRLCSTRVQTSEISRGCGWGSVDSECGGRYKGTRECGRGNAALGYKGTRVQRYKPSKNTRKEKKKPEKKKGGTQAVT
jgi:hypothetical protein